MFEYGKTYGKIPLKDISKLGLSSYGLEKYAFWVRLYFKLFGYPDAAAQVKFRFVAKTLKFKEKDKLLDAGCGIGIYLQGYSAKYGLSGYGVDIDVSRVALAKKVNGFLKQDNLFKISRLEKLNLGKNKFNKIICVDVLEHIKKDALALKSIGGYLNPGGIMLVTIPRSPLDVNYSHKPIEKYGHVRRGYSRNELMAMAKSAGFSKIKITTYFGLFTHYAVRFQQFLYRKTPFYLNAFFSPILTLITLLDDFAKIKPSEYVLIIRK
jgi:cyclopropane fatty-acyl-phospholipid synthase-like methyltransferase